MHNNPFQTPSSELEKNAKPERPGSIWLGVLIGGIVDFGTTMIFGIVAGIFYAIKNMQPGMTPEDMEQMITKLQEEIIDFSSPFGMLTLFFGCVGSVLGGYICALLAKLQWQKALLILIVVMVGYGLYMGAEYYSVGMNIGFALLTIFCISLGGWLRGRKIVRQ
jgi:hypothetical protein